MLYYGLNIDFHNLILPMTPAYYTYYTGVATPGGISLWTKRLSIHACSLKSRHLNPSYLHIYIFRYKWWLMWALTSSHAGRIGIERLQHSRACGELFHRNWQDIRGPSEQWSARHPSLLRWKGHLLHVWWTLVIRPSNICGLGNECVEPWEFGALFLPPDSNVEFHNPGMSTSV